MPKALPLTLSCPDGFALARAAAGGTHLFVLETVLRPSHADVRASLGILSAGTFVGIHPDSTTSLLTVTVDGGETLTVIPYGRVVVYGAEVLEQQVARPNASAPKAAAGSSGGKQ